MVSYTEWTDVVFEAAEGFDMDENDVQQLVSELAAYWETNKDELKAMSRRQALKRAKRIVEPP